MASHTRLRWPSRRPVPRQRMPAQRPIFRIEEALRPDRPIANEAANADVLNELKAVRALLEGGVAPNVAPELAELRTLRAETELIQQVINRTKREISMLYANGV